MNSFDNPHKILNIINFDFENISIPAYLWSSHYTRCIDTVFCIFYHSAFGTRILAKRRWISLIWREDWRMVPVGRLSLEVMQQVLDLVWGFIHNCGKEAAIKVHYYYTVIHHNNCMWRPNLSCSQLKCLSNFLNIPAIDTHKTTSPSLVTLVHIHDILVSVTGHTAQCPVSALYWASPALPVIPIPIVVSTPASHPPQQTLPGASLDNHSLTFIMNMTQTFIWSYYLGLLIWLYFVCMYIHGTIK